MKVTCTCNRVGRFPKLHVVVCAAKFPAQFVVFLTKLSGTEEAHARNGTVFH